MPEYTRQQFGQESEELAAEFLSKQGYQIIAKNIRYKLGEIDLIAKEDQTLCFIEVRSRSNSRFMDPKASIQTGKQTKLIRASQLYLQKFYKFQRPPCRFDAVSIIGYGKDRKFELVKHAFQLNIQPRKRSGNPWQAF